MDDDNPHGPMTRRGFIFAGVGALLGAAAGAATDPGEQKPAPEKKPPMAERKTTKPQPPAPRKPDLPPDAKVFSPVRGWRRVLGGAGLGAVGGMAVKRLACDKTEAGATQSRKEAMHRDFKERRRDEWHWRREEENREPKDRER